MDDTPDIAIIGAGPAGIAAAIQLKRYGISPLIFEGGTVGGLLINARFVENYPGFPKGITGPGLVKKLRSHLKSTRVKLITDTVIELDYSNNEFYIKTDLVPYTAQIIIIASGTKPIIPSKPEISASVQDRVFSEIYAIRNAVNKTFVIIGAGDAAFDYALNLGEGNDVIILNRGKQIKALAALQEETAQTYNIKYFEDTLVQGLTDLDGERVIVTCQREKRTIEIEADYVIFAIGREPELSFISDKLNEQIPGLLDSGNLYLIGDVNNGIYRQTAIAAGDGIRAAMKIYMRLT